MTKYAVAQAREWLKAHGRPLEQAVFKFHFEDGPAPPVTSALTAFQNPDGGFGHGLEPDVRLADSSAVATTVALQTLRAIDAPASDPLVAGAIEFLLNQLDIKTLGWPLVPANVNDAPHAPWWTPPEAPSGFTPNPGAEIVGHLWHWNGTAPTELRDRLTEAALVHLREHAAELPMHDVLCYEWLRKTTAVPQAIRDEILSLIHRPAVALVETDPAAWAGYGLRPLQLADAPDSPHLPELQASVSANLDYLIDTQQEDGSWMPSWTWGDAEGTDQAAWEQAKQEWQGRLIVEHLELLSRFDRIATGAFSPKPSSHA